MGHIGYVVIEWNQASGQPKAMPHSFTTYRDDADAVKKNYEEILPLARRETYTVAAVVSLEED
jgi:hypothetical protein